MSTAKPSARFLPTLTEVVHVLPQQATRPGPEADHEGPIVQRAMELLEARMHERIEALVQTTQAQNMLNALRDEMRQAVVDAVKQAMREAE